LLLEKRKQESALPKLRGLLPASELSFIPSQVYDEEFITSQMSYLETSHENSAIFGISAWNRIVAEAGQKHPYGKRTILFGEHV
jgi:hypothetical protein